MKKNSRQIGILFNGTHRSVAQLARASVSKTEGRGFKSLHSCQFFMTDYQLSRPVFLLMHGLPGAGKSYFARQFAQSLRLIHIDTDRIRYELFDDPQYEPAENNTVFRLAEAVSQWTLQNGYGLIFDMYLPTKTIRKGIAKLAKNYGAEFLIVWVQTDMATIKARAMNRDRRRPDDRYNPSLNGPVFDRLHKSHHPPTDEQRVVISGKFPFRLQRQTVLNRLSRLGCINSGQLRSVPAPESTYLGARRRQRRRI